MLTSCKCTLPRQPRGAEAGSKDHAEASPAGRNVAGELYAARVATGLVGKAAAQDSGSDPLGTQGAAALPTPFSSNVTKSSLPGQVVVDAASRHAITPPFKKTLKQIAP